jgi:hypothetical protein
MEKYVNSIIWINLKIKPDHQALKTLKIQRIKTLKKDYEIPFLVHPNMLLLRG